MKSDVEDAGLLEDRDAVDSDSVGVDVGVVGSVDGNVAIDVRLSQACIVAVLLRHCLCCNFVRGWDAIPRETEGAKRTLVSTCCF